MSHNNQSVWLRGASAMLLLAGVAACQPAEVAQELPPQWQHAQSQLDDVKSASEHDYVYQLDDATLVSAYSAMLLNYQCHSLTRNVQERREIEARAAEALEDYRQALFTANEFSRQLGLMQINLLLEDNRLRGEGPDLGLLTEAQRSRINGFHTFDDGLMANPRDIDASVIQAVQQSAPQHPVAQLDFGTIELAQRFRTLSAYWQAMETHGGLVEPDCAEVEVLLAQVDAAIEAR
ncbi:hypothetical protein [Ferrimonas pelagia]|uniref:Uncharacterized protein n=1 Tax=Ferrimonas pelagia TaxID=1177826 RepID=A0ABP9FB87_9GAMM